MTPRRVIAAVAILAAATIVAFYFIPRHSINPAGSKSYLERMIIDSGSSLESLTAAEAIRFMLTFYRDIRADDCPLDKDGDVLFFQTGASDSGLGETYRYDITRQFRSGPRSEHGVSELSLTVHFVPTDNLRALKGIRWCSSPIEADEFEQFIRSNAATQAVSTLKPLKVTLSWKSR